VKKLIALACVLVLAGVFASAQELSQADRDKGVQYLEQTRDGVVASVQGLSDAQLHFKAGPDRWSIAECLEHIALAEDFLFMNVEQNVMRAGPGAPNRDTAKIDAAVLAMVPDRSHKAQAPPQLVPTGRWTPDEALKHFLASREKTTEFMKTEPGLRAHAVEMPPIGQQLDGYEWLLFIAAHSKRHTEQIEEVKADPNFPKS
jgi:DinB superfamily